MDLRASARRARLGYSYCMHTVPSLSFPPTRLLPPTSVVLWAGSVPFVAGRVGSAVPYENDIFVTILIVIYYL